MTRRIAALTVVSLVLTSGCGGPSRSRAEEVLRAKFPREHAKQAMFEVWAAGSCFGLATERCGPDAVPAPIKQLEALGLISIAYEGGSRLSFTEQGLQYALNGAAQFPTPNGHQAVWVWTATSEFGSVTSISAPDASNSVTVEFTTVVRPTPFGQFDPVTEKHTARFQKYDDVWKLVTTQ